MAAENYYVNAFRSMEQSPLLQLARSIVSASTPTHDVRRLIQTCNIAEVREPGEDRLASPEWVHWPHHDSDDSPAWLPAIGTSLLSDMSRSTRTIAYTSQDDSEASSDDGQNVLDFNLDINLDALSEETRVASNTFRSCLAYSFGLLADTATVAYEHLATFSARRRELLQAIQEVEDMNCRMLIYIRGERQMQLQLIQSYGLDVVLPPTWISDEGGLRG